MALSRAPKKNRWLFRAAVLTVVSGAFSINELRYAASGKTTNGEIRNIGHFVQAGRSWRTFFRGGQDQKTIEYSYRDEADNERRTERDQVANDWTMPKSGEVKVQYIPGEKGTSRVTGNRNLVPVAGFAVFLIVTVILTLKWAREYELPGQKPKRGKRPR